MSLPDWVRAIMRGTEPPPPIRLPAPPDRDTASDDVRTRILAELNATSPEELEKLAGKLLVLSTKRRLARLNPGDRHEVRHIEAQLLAGATDDDRPDSCALDSVQWQDFEVVRSRQLKSWSVRRRRAEREAGRG